MDLLIETTTYSVAIGLAETGKIIAEDHWEAEQRLATELTTHIEKLLESQGKKFSVLSGIRVHSGPGGFSTLRIGVVEANTLSFALKIPVVGILGEFSDLESLCKAEVSQTSGPIKPTYRRPPLIGEIK